MRIALFGYGKMGKMIEGIALNRGHEISARIDLGKAEDIDYNKIDLAIDFSVPEAAVANIETALENGIPVVSGTTGWLDHYDHIVQRCDELGGAFLYASNFSLGVNIFFALNEYLAQKMSALKQYGVSIEEIHHTQKQDAPSGTAITLAEGVLANTEYKNWRLGEAEDGEIPIVSKRIGNYAGTHTVDYDSSIDQIRIQHTAHSRKGFAEGAVIAAEWLLGKKGVFSMQDVLNLG
ncbi:4-hydroxy-tetrahydrodipicolinate reductase [Flavobacteriaceae bacterium D16]|nr:4-hydroxy-tetrahydrodipicolinate reductase [Flavobacteriaceae bacterium D16]